MRKRDRDRERCARERERKRDKRVSQVERVSMIEKKEIYLIR